VTSLLLDYWQRETRAEAYARRARLFASDVTALRKAGRLAEAAEAAAIQAAGPAAFAPSTPEGYEADERMDRALEAFDARRYSTALRQVRHALRQYREAGAGRLWDLVDALLLTGAAAACSGDASVAVDALAEAAGLMRAQACLPQWLRSVVMLLAVRVSYGMAPPDPAVLAGLAKTCHEHGCFLEYLCLRLLVVEGLIRVGDLREARRQLLAMRSLAAEAGEPGLAMLRSVLRGATVRRSLQLVVGDLADQRPKTIGAARRILLEWDSAGATPRQLLRAIRAGQLLLSIRPEDHALVERQRKLSRELAEVTTIPSQRAEKGKVRQYER